MDRAQILEDLKELLNGRRKYDGSGGPMQITAIEVLGWINNLEEEYE